MRYYRVIVMVLVFVLAYGIACLAAVEECTKCDPAHNGDTDTLADADCDESSDIGNKSWTSAVKGDCTEENTQDCEEDTATKPVVVDEYECMDDLPQHWQGTGEEQTLNTEDCTDSDR